MNFENLAVLVNSINSDLGSFCNTFQYKRKELIDGGRTAANNELFRNVKTEEIWTINKGGGTEVQYHLAIEDDDKTVRYGLGFNTQYVPFATNDTSPVDLMRPYMDAFLKLEPKLRKKLPDYEFIHGSRKKLQNPVYGEYTLFGKKISYAENETDYVIADPDYKMMLSDLQTQFEPYVQIFELRNKLIAMTERVSEYSNLFELKPQIILQGPPGTGKTYTAKDIAENVIFGSVTADKIEQKKKLTSSEQFEIIQFHPAYSYEDFVRGITVDTTDNVVVYEAKNKTIGNLCEKALKNLNDSQKEADVLSKEKWVSKEIEAFAESIEDIIEKNRKYPLTNIVSIFEVDGDAFRYKGETWDVQTMQRMKFIDIVLEYLNNAANRREIKATPGISGRAKEHSTYDFKLLEKFREFLKNRQPFVETVIKEPRKNYVLIIDEINRANLPAVLGELIYALEYRDEPVTGMYKVDGNNRLTLPSNLYIIGTMNTADRSVGHIDYAVRRRFAFVDILPNIEPVTPAALPLFKQVSNLFIKNFDTLNWSSPKLDRSEELAADFRPEDVWLGHSYFISSKTTDEEIKADLQLKLDYEKKPLLKEYLKDGLLLPEAEVKIKALHV